MMGEGKRTSIRVGMVCCEDLPKWGGADCSKLCAATFEARGFGNQQHQRPEHQRMLADLGMPAPENSQPDIQTTWESPSIDWAYFDAVTGCLPRLSELQNFDGFIMTGSHYSAYEPLEWIQKYESWIRELAKFQRNNSKPPRVFAVCFSHHALNKALGGSVDCNQDKFVWNMEDVKLHDGAKKHPFFKGLIESGKEFPLTLYESHGDSVKSIPPMAECLASSSSCDFEMVSIGSDIISIQGHPEFSNYEMVDKILPALKKSGVVTEMDSKKAMTAFKQHDGGKILKLLERYFLRIE